VYLSYSGYKTYEDCPRQYWYKYIGKPKLPPENRVNSLYGSTVGTIFENFYNDELWRKPNVRRFLHDMAEDVMSSVMAGERKKGGDYDWNDPLANYHSAGMVLQDVSEAIETGLATIKLNRLLGPEAKAELDLTTDYGGHRLGGRADFVIRRSVDKDLLILDGKGSRHFGKYTSGTQLRWYAALYLKRFDLTPDKLGFLYWRSKPEDALVWEDFTVSGLDMLLATVIGTVVKIESGLKTLDGKPPEVGVGPFQPLPESGRCRLCAYESLCPKDGKGSKGRTRAKVLVPVSEDGDVFL
jgi:hypothetical protein